MSVAYSLLAVTTLAVLASPAAGQEIKVTELKPCPNHCGIALVPVRQYGDDSGPGMLETGGAIVGLDTSGRLYLADMGGSETWVFDSDGRVLNRIGRGGEGPGEIRRISSLAIVDDGLFSILDSGRGRILTFAWTGELKHEARTQGWSPIGHQTLHSAGPWLVHYADLRTPDLAGYPLHLVNLETGERQESFGSVTGELSADYRGHVIGDGPGRSIWMARSDAYHVELWKERRLHRTMTRNVAWFPATTHEEVGHGRNDEPTPYFAGIQSDDSLLWVSVLVADDRWATAFSDSGYDPDMYFDTMVEVIDWQADRVVASERFDLTYSWVAPGLLGKLEIMATGSVRYRTYRVELDGLKSAARPRNTIHPFPREG